MIGKIKKFLREVKLEFKKVSWSSRPEVIGSTIVVFVFLIILAIYIGIVDMMLSRIITFLIK
jgi:preprotein translocase subunit SecE